MIPLAFYFSLVQVSASIKKHNKHMHKTQKREYVAPNIRTLQVGVENGYALSLGGDNPQPVGLTGGNESFTGGGSFNGTSFN